MLNAGHEAEDVDAIGAEHLEVLVDAAADGLASGLLVDAFAVVYIAGKDDLVALALESDAELLALVVIVGVKEVDPTLDGAIDDRVTEVLTTSVLVLPARTVEVAAEADLGDLKPRGAERTVVHLPRLALGGEER